MPAAYAGGTAAYAREKPPLLPRTTEREASAPAPQWLPSSAEMAPSAVGLQRGCGFAVFVAPVIAVGIAALMMFGADDVLGTFLALLAAPFTTFLRARTHGMTNGDAVALGAISVIALVFLLLFMAMAMAVIYGHAMPDFN